MGYVSMMTNGGLMGGAQKNMFNVRSSNSGSSIYLGSTQIISDAQIESLTATYDAYAFPMQMKRFESIPTDYTAYIALLDKLQAIYVFDSKLSLLLNIAIAALVGAMNLHTMYEAYAYDEVKVAILTKRLDEVLAGKNAASVIAGEGTTSTMVATKTIKLSPVFSYYVYLYGLPAYGVGFDPAKLGFLQRMPVFSPNAV